MRLRLPSAAPLAAVPGYGVVRRFAERCFSDDVRLLAGALAYQFFLALFPFAILVAAISGALVRRFGLPDVAQLLFGLVEQLPPPASDALRAELQQLVAGDAPRLLSVTVAGTLWAATSGANTLLVAMDRANGVPAARRGLGRMLVAGGLTLLAGWALVAGGLMVGLLQIFERALTRLLEGIGAPAPPGELVLWGALAGLAFVAAAGVYRLAPNVSQTWRGVLPGALLFGLGWLVLTVGFSVFVTAFADLGVTYGTLAGAVALLIWLYWTAYLLLAGAVLNAVLLGPPGAATLAGTGDPAGGTGSGPKEGRGP